MADYRIETRTGADGHTVYQLWQVFADGADAVLFGEYESKDAAEAALTTAVADPDREPHPGLGTTDSEPVDFGDDEVYEK